MPSWKLRNEFGAYGPTDVGTRGQSLDHSQDLSPSFMVGYEPRNDLLYVAVEVRDDVLHNPPGGSATRTDACEIYVSGLRGDAPGNGPTQYVMVPGRHNYAGFTGNPGVKGGRIGNTETRGAWRRRGDVTTYEWQVQVFDRPRQRTRFEDGMVIGFDVVVADGDGHDDTGRDTAAWVPWGPAVSAKRIGNERIGRLVIAPEAWSAGFEDGPVHAYLTSWLKDHRHVHEAWDRDVGLAVLQARLTKAQADQELQREIRRAIADVQSEANAAARVAETVARAAAATASAVAAAEARALEIEVPPVAVDEATWELVPRWSQPPLPAPVPDRSLERNLISVVGGCALILMVGFAAYLIRRGGKERATPGAVKALEERIASIESRLTDTQDVMIALSEKLDRIDDAGRTGEES
jgi:hypothetical protein